MGWRSAWTAQATAAMRLPSWPAWPRPTGLGISPRTSGRPSGCCKRQSQTRPIGAWPKCIFSSRLKLELREAGAHALLAQLYWDAARYDEAEPHLVSAAAAVSALHLRLAELHAARQDWQQVAREANLAVPFFRDRCRSAPQDVSARVFWAEAEVLAGRHADAVRILRAELDSADRSVYLQTLGRVYASWTAAVERNAKADPAQRLQLVEEGLKYDAGNSDLLSALTPERTRPDEAAQTRELLLRLISDGRAPAAANLILGMDAWQRRDFDAARVHWETAPRLAPQLNVAANNLAWLLAHEEPRDLTRALALHRCRPAGGRCSSRAFAARAAPSWPAWAAGARPCPS